MKKLFGLMAAGVLLTAPAFAQLTVTTNPATGAAKAGDKVTICLAAGADVKGVAGWSLTFTLPKGWTVPADAKFVADAGPTGLAVGALNQINNTSATDSKVIVGLVGSDDKSGPGPLGCLDTVAGATAVTGPIGLAVEANNANADPVAVTVKSTDLKMAGPVTPPPPTGTGGLNITATAGANNKQTLCLTAGADVKNVAGWSLTFKLPAGYTAAADAKFVADANGLAAGALNQINNTSATNGQIIVGLVGSDNKSGPGPLGCLDVTGAQGAVAGPVQLTVEANDADANPVAVTVAPTPTLPAVGGPPPPPKGLGPKSGDADANGKVEVADVRLAIQILFGINKDAAAIAAADITGDGTVDLRDIRMALQKAVGIIK